MNEKFKEKIVFTLPVALLISFTFFVFGPLEMYITNASEFWFSITDLLLPVFVSFILALAIIWGILMLLKGQIQKYSIAILWGIGVALYIQGNYLNFGYGVLDGTAINWNFLSVTSLGNTFIWLLLLILPIFILIKKTTLLNKFIRISTVFILSVQIITLGVLIFTSDNLIKKSETVLTNEGIFTLSAKENVLIFILDAYDASIYNSFISLYPVFKDTLLKDFTFYENTVGGATRTKLALPYILTGEPYMSPVSYGDYIEQSFKKTPLFTELKKLNYDTRIYTSSTFIPSSQIDNIKNLKETKPKVGSYPNLTYYLYRMTGFRYMPYILKPYFWMYSGDFEKVVQQGGNQSVYQINDPVFYSMLQEQGISLLNDKNVFRVYHLHGAHPPYPMDENAQSVDYKSNTEEKQLLGLMRILDTFFAEMKEKGIYDNATIFIMADHGQSTPANPCLEQNPLLLIKRKNEKKEYSISQIPVSYANLQSTFLKVIGSKEAGKSIFELTEEDNYTRYFYVDGSSNNNIQIIEYKTNDIAKNSLAFVKTGRVGYGDSQNIPPYELGTVLSFLAEDDTARPYLVKGFSTSELIGTWTDGNFSELVIPLNKNVNKLKELKVICKLASIYGNRQGVKIFVNGNFLVEQLVTENTFEFIIPHTLLKDQKLNISFAFPDASSPASDGVSNDRRDLALMFKSLVIEERN